MTGLPTASALVPVSESICEGLAYGMVRRDHGWSVIQLGELININFVLNSQGLGVVEQGLGVVFWAK